MAFDVDFINQVEKDREQVQTLTQTFYRDTKLSWRVKTILNYNPYMSNNIDAVMQMAQMPVPDNELFASAGAMYGMQSADLLANQLNRYAPSTQRAIFSTLTVGQQQTLKQMGYQPSRIDLDEGNFVEQLLGGAVSGLGEAASFVFSGIGRKVMPVVGPALNLLDEASDFVVGRPYRTIRQLDGEAQLAAILGAGLGAAGALLVPVTGGASLALTGLGAVIGGSAASLGQQTFVGNSDDWFEAWSKASNGERLFSNSGVRNASEILGDPKLVNMAKKLAENLDDDTTLIEIAQEVAGVEGSLNPATQQKQLAKIASEFAEQGTPMYQEIYGGLTELINDPLFREAVKVLEQSKISIGRDLARGIGFDPDSDAYRWISGTIDAATLIVMDPFLIAGKTARAVNMARKGIFNLDAAKAAERFMVLSKNPAIKRTHDIFADAINTGSTTLVKRYVPWLMPVWNDFLTHTKTAPELAGRAVKGEDFANWVIGANQMKSLMQGVGMVQGVSYGMLRGVNKFQYALRTKTGVLSDFMAGAADANLETVLKKLSDNPQALTQLINELPPEWATHLVGIADDDLPFLANLLKAKDAPETLSSLVKSLSGVDPRAYEAGRQYSRLPFVKTVGSLYNNMATLSPRGSIIMLQADQGESVSDINAFIDLFQTVGMPTYVREIWKQAIWQSPEISTRIHLLTSLIDSAATATGMRATKSGSDLIDNFVNHVRQEYGIGPNGRIDLPVSGGRTLQDIPVAVKPDADGAIMMQIPDLKMMRQAVKQGTLLRVLTGVSDNIAVEAFQNKFWKPAVLLRFGFFVRNASEDLLAFVTRAGFGHFTQEFAARSVADENVYKTALAQITPGKIIDGKLYGVPLNRPIRGRIDNVIDPAERIVLKRNSLIPAHMRPVARIVDRFGASGSPTFTMFEDYGKWLREHIKTGFIFPSKAILGKTSDRLQEIASRTSDITGATNRAKTNFFLNLDLLAFGSEYSTRRLLFGGVDPTLVRSAESFVARNAGSIMQRVGATSALPWTIEDGSQQIVQRSYETAEGVKQTMWLRMQGERTHIAPGTRDISVDDYHESIHKNVVRLTDDSLQSRVLLEVAKVYDEEMQALIPPDTLRDLISAWSQTERRAMSEGTEEVNHLILLLLSDPSDYKRYNAFVEGSIGLGGMRFDDDGTSRIVDYFRKDLVDSFQGQAMPTVTEFANLTSAKLKITKNNLNRLKAEQKALFRKANKNEFDFEDLEGLSEQIYELTIAVGDLEKINTFGRFAKTVDDFLETIADESGRLVARRWLSANFFLDASTRGAHFSGFGAEARDLGNILRDWRLGRPASPDELLNEEPFRDTPSPEGFIPVQRDYERFVKDAPFTIGGFYTSLDEAMYAGKQKLAVEISEGRYESILQQSLRNVPAAPGQQFWLIKPSPATEGLITPEMLVDVGLLYDDFQPNISFLANRMANQPLTESQRADLFTFTQNFINSVRNGQPFIVSNPNAAQILQDVITNIHKKYFDLGPVTRRKVYLPVAEGQFSSTYPELADRTSTFWMDNPEGTGVIPLSSVSWDPNIYPTPETYLDEAIASTYPQDLVDSLVMDIEQNIRGGRRVRHVVRDDVNVYIRINGRPEKLVPGTYVDAQTELFADSDLKKRIGTLSESYFKTEDVTYTGNTNIMWKILAPTLIDLAEEMGGRPVRAIKNWQTVRVSKALSEFGSPGTTFDIPTDVIRMRAAKVQDVIDTPADMLPDYAVGQMYEPLNQNAWDKVVQFGFDRVLSPMLDAVARRPMAFHAYVNAHQRNMASVQWLFRGSVEEQEVNGVARKLLQNDTFRAAPEQLDRYEEAGRLVARIHNISEEQYWSAEQAIAYLRSLTPEEFSGLYKAGETALAAGRLNKKPSEVKALLSFVDSNSEFITKMTLSDEATAWRFIDRIDGYFGEGSAVSGGFISNKELYKKLQNSKKHYSEINSRSITGEIQVGSEEFINNLNYTMKLVEEGKIFALDNQTYRVFEALDPEDWEILRRGARLRNKAFEQANEYAAEYAIRDIMPFIDTAEVRSQFADWARGYLPFWYAEENFLKRWARIMTLEGPTGTLARARKLQLTAQGLRTMGVVRDDPNGNSYFVYPGSELLAESLSKIPGLELLPISALLQTPTDRMIPGFNPQFGAPGLSPLVALPVEFATYLFPESSSIRNFQRNVFGDISVNQDIWNIFVPAQVSNTFRAIYEFTQPYESTGNERVQSAQMAAMAHLEAEGNGLPEDATSSQVDDYLRRVRNHARVIVLSQAIAGWFTPGPAQSLQLSEDQSSLSWLTEGAIENPAEILSATYFEMIQNLGIEEGTQMYLARFPDNTIGNVLEPIAYTVSKTETPSGAPLPMSEDGIMFYENNKMVFDQYSLAGPWLLPQDRSKESERSQYAYDAAMIEGLRTRKTPEEFLRELKFREGSTIYFSARKAYLDEYAKLKQQKQSASMKRLRETWDMFAQLWKSTHPIFADVLVNSDSRERRQNVIGEMRYLLSDPDAPRASHFDSMKTLMDSFDLFMTERSRLGLNKTAYARGQVESLKGEFDSWVTQFTANNPEVNSFWLTVLRPESGLD
jgi:hypothetical protein